MVTKRKTTTKKGCGCAAKKPKNIGNYWNHPVVKCPIDKKRCNESYSPKPAVNKDSFMLSCRYGSWDQTRMHCPAKRKGGMNKTHTIVGRFGGRGD